MRSDEVRLELVEVDLDDAVVEALRVPLDLGVDPQVVGVLVGEIGDLFALGGLQVHRGSVVVREHRARGADLGAHVADRRLARRRDRLAPGAEVLDDRAGPALHGEDSGDLEDDVLWRRPSRQPAREVHADDLRHLRVERPARHDVDGIGAAHADRDHAEAAGVGRVAVGTEHHPARERVLLEHDLVDDPRARVPEADAVLRRDGAQELVHLGVGVDRVLQVDLGADPGLDEVVAVHRRRHRHAREPRGHELQQRHLRGRVLHRDAVGPVVGVVGAPLEPDGVRVLGVREQHLLGVRERPPQAVTAHRDPFRVAAVDLLDERDGRRELGRVGHLFPSVAATVGQSRRCH